MRNRLHEIIPTSAPVPPVDVVIEPSLAGRALELLQRVQIGEKHTLLVCDGNTHKALAERLVHELGKTVALLVLENPQADDATVKLLRSHKAEAYVAVGSGTLGDLCKYASFLEGKPYAVFPTAPSMNGYLSANASITINHHKKSLAAHLPVGVFCDLGVLAAAPLRLIRSGLGDSLCRPTAQADWLLSHLLLGTVYDPLPFSFLEPYEEDLLKYADKLNERSPFAIELLTRTLLASGLGMVVAGGSYPASQGEHLLAHAMEMKHGASLQSSFHGEQIGVTTLIMAELQYALLDKPVRLRRHSDWLQTALGYFGENMREEIENAGKGKFDVITLRFEEINDILTTEKNQIREALHHVMRPKTQIENALKRAGAPTTIGELGWNQPDVDAALHHACYMRDRFTFLDLV